MSKIYDSVAKVLGDRLSPQLKDERRKFFLLRVIKTLRKIPEDVFEKLPERAADWANAQLQNLQKGKPIDDFPDATNAEKQQGKVQSPGRPKNPPRPPGPARAPKGKKKHAGKKGKVLKIVKKEKAVREISAKQTFAELRLRYPDKSIPDLEKLLKDKGFKLADQTMVNIDGHTKNVVRAATRIGWVPPKKEEKKDAA